MKALLENDSLWKECSVLRLIISIWVNNSVLISHWSDSICAVLYIYCEIVVYFHTIFLTPCDSHAQRICHYYFRWYCTILKFNQFRQQWFNATSLPLYIYHFRFHKMAFIQSGRSPKVVAFFLLLTVLAILYNCFNCMIQFKIERNSAWIQYNIVIRSHLMI